MPQSSKQLNNPYILGFHLEQKWHIVRAQWISRIDIINSKFFIISLNKYLLDITLQPDPIGEGGIEKAVYSKRAIDSDQGWLPPGFTSHKDVEGWLREG